MSMSLSQWTPYNWTQSGSFHIKQRVYLLHIWISVSMEKSRSVSRRWCISDHLNSGIRNTADLASLLCPSDGAASSCPKETCCLESWMHCLQTKKKTKHKTHTLVSSSRGTHWNAFNRLEILDIQQVQTAYVIPNKAKTITPVLFHGYTKTMN